MWLMIGIRVNAFQTRAPLRELDEMGRNARWVRERRAKGRDAERDGMGWAVGGTWGSSCTQKMAAAG